MLKEYVNGSCLGALTCSASGKPRSPCDVFRNPVKWRSSLGGYKVPTTTVVGKKITIGNFIETSRLGLEKRTLSTLILTRYRNPFERLRIPWVPDLCPEVDRKVAGCPRPTESEVAGSSLDSGGGGEEDKEKEANRIAISSGYVTLNQNDSELFARLGRKL
uniref:Uncharacterized protein n=1 Tax=Steinernema glaseri TaxID=37863 RepID=A0A1I8AT97_9BILA